MSADYDPFDPASHGPNQSYKTDMSHEASQLQDTSVADTSAGDPQALPDPESSSPIRVEPSGSNEASSSNADMSPKASDSIVATHFSNGSDDTRIYLETPRLHVEHVEDVSNLPQALASEPIQVDEEGTNLMTEPTSNHGKHSHTDSLGTSEALTPDLSSDQKSPGRASPLEGLGFRAPSIRGLPPADFEGGQGNGWAAPSMLPSSIMPAQPTEDRTAEKILRIQNQYPLDNTRAVNVLLVGRAGNGKSSLINTMYQTLTGKKETLCREGSVDASCTLRYACTAEMYNRAKVPLMLFDTKGWPDSRDRPTQKLLQNVMRGKFKPEKSMNNPKWKDCYVFPDKSIRIDVVIFVYAYGSIFPHRLAECLAEEAKRRGVTVMPVITFYDHVEHDDQLGVTVDSCSRTFNTTPIYLTNFSAVDRLPPETGEPVKIFTKDRVLDLVSQLMIYGQKHQRKMKYDINKPQSMKDSKDCSIM